MTAEVGGPMIFAHAGHWIADLLFPLPFLLILVWVLVANYRSRREIKKSGAGEAGEDKPKRQAEVE